MPAISGVIAPEIVDTSGIVMQWCLK